LLANPLASITTFNINFITKDRSFMGKFKDITGWVMKEHGVPESKLTVLRPVGVNKQGNYMWECECSCEERNHIISCGGNILNGHVSSCGCSIKEKAIETGASLRKLNTYEINLEDDKGIYGIGYTSNNSTPFYFDMVDYDVIKEYTWNDEIDHTGYHQLRTSSKPRKRFHAIIGLSGYDHIDRNPLNNRRYNLRETDIYDNATNKGMLKNNTSGVKGVQKREDGGWRAILKYRKEKLLDKTFMNFEDAVRARLLAEKEYLGDLAPQKSLYAQYGI
jgi:hypothetical protein